MSKIPALMGGRALEHDIALEKGKGLKVKGQSTLLSFAGSADNLLSLRGQAFDMGGATRTLIINGNTVGAQTKITANVLMADAGGSGADLMLPAEGISFGVILLIFNTGGETITVKSDAPATIIVIQTTEHGIVYCDGTTWRGFMGAET